MLNQYRLQSMYEPGKNFDFDLSTKRIYIAGTFRTVNTEPLRIDFTKVSGRIEAVTQNVTKLAHRTASARSAQPTILPALGKRPLTEPSSHDALQYGLLTERAPPKQRRVEHDTGPKIAPPSAPAIVPSTDPAVRQLQYQMSGMCKTFVEPRVRNIGKEIFVYYTGTFNRAAVRAAQQQQISNTQASSSSYNQTRHARIAQYAIDQAGSTLTEGCLLQGLVASRRQRNTETHAHTELQLQLLVDEGRGHLEKFPQLQKDCECEAFLIVNFGYIVAALHST